MLTLHNVGAQLKGRGISSHSPHLDGAKTQGMFALVAACDNWPTVSFHDTREQAEQVKTRINQTGCGGQCTRQHYILEA
jgi:hypothetical protein